MRRKLNWCGRVIYNVIKKPFLFLIYGFQIKTSFISMFSPGTKIRIDEKGRIQIGTRCLIEDGTLLSSTGGKLTIGNHVYINRFCNIICRESITISSRVTIGPNVSVYDHDHNYRRIGSNDYISSSVFIDENVWIGAGVIILKGVRIGKNSVIGAGSVVTNDIAENSLVFPNKQLEIRRIPNE